jgi:hypothetical protein
MSDHLTTRFVGSITTNVSDARKMIVDDAMCCIRGGAGLLTAQLLDMAASPQFDAGAIDDLLTEIQDVCAAARQLLGARATHSDDGDTDA